MQDRESLLTNIYQILDDKKATKEIENLRNCPSDYNSWNRLGNILLNNGYYDLAVECYKHVLNHNPSSTYALYNIGLALFNMNRYEESIEYYKKVIDLDPNNADAFGAIAVSLQHQNKDNEATKYFEISKKLHKEKIHSIFIQAEEFRSVGQFDYSIKFYDQILSLEPAHIESLYNKGLSLLELRENKEALECFQKVIELDNDYADAWYNKGLSLLELRENKEALECFQKVIELDNDYADAWYNKAKIELENNNFQQALEYYHNALSLYQNKEKRSKVIRTLKDIRNIYANNIYEFSKSSIKTSELMKLDREDLFVQAMYTEDLILTGNYQKSRKFNKEALTAIPDEKITVKTLLKFFSLCSSLLDNSLLSNSDHYINEFLEFYQKLDEDFIIKQETWNFDGLKRNVSSVHTSDENKKFLYDVIDMLRGSTREKSKVLAKFASNLAKSKIDAKQRYKKYSVTGISTVVIASIFLILAIPYILPPIATPFSNILVNQTIGDIQIDPEQSKLYYTVPHNGKFFTVDWNDNRTLKSMSLPNGSDNIKLDTKYDRIYVTNYDSNNLTIIDKIYSTNPKIDKLKVLPGTVDIELSDNATMAFIANYKNKSIDIYDLNNKTQNNSPQIKNTIKPIEIPYHPQSYPQIYQQSLSFNAQENELYVIEASGHNITTINLKDLKKESSIFLGNGKIANGMVFNSKYDKVYALDYFASKIYVIDVKKKNVVAIISVGKLPVNMIPDKDEGLLYVANEYSKSISIIDCSTDAVIKTIALNKSPFKVAYDAKKNHIFVHYKEDFSIERISLDKVDTKNTISTGNDPGMLFVNDKRNEIYVIDNTDLSIINGANNTINKVIPVGSASLIPNDIVYDHKNDLLFVVNIYKQKNPYENVKPGNLLIFNASYPYNLIDNVTVGFIPTSIAVSDKSGKIYVSHYKYNHVYVIVKDGEQYRVQANISLGDVDGSSDIAVNFNNDNDIIYVANTLSDTITIIKENSTSGKINYDLTYKTVGKGPSELLFDSKNNKLYVVNRISDTISVFSPERDSIVRTILVGESPIAITSNTNSSKNLLYVSNSGSNSISIIDPSKDIIYPVTTTDSLGRLPNGIIYNPHNEMIYVSNKDSNYISLINSSSIKLDSISYNKHIVKNIQVNKGPISLKTNQKDNLVYVINRFSDAVSKINSSNDNVIIDEKSIKHAVLSNSLDYNVKNNEMYILNDVNDDISIFQTNGTLLDTIKAGPDPTSITVGVEDNDLYITNANLKNITRIDKEDHTKIIKIPTDFVPTQVISASILPPKDCPGITDSSLFFVLFHSQEEEILYVYSDFENSYPLLTKKIGKGQSSLAFDGINKIYLTNELSESLRIIDLCKPEKSIKTIPLDSPTDVTVDPNTDTVYVAHQMSDIVSVIDGKTNKITEKIKVMPSPTSMDIDLDLGKVYVTSYKTNTISVISNSK